MEEQSGREFASADPTAGAQDATLQERGLTQKFLSTDAAVYNTFNVNRTLARLRALSVARRVATGQTDWGPAAQCTPASAWMRVPGA